MFRFLKPIRKLFPTPLAKTHKTGIPAQLTLMETLFDPLPWTSQERWFINECIKSELHEPMVVSNFRGCGKTTTLWRIRKRAPMGFLTRQVHFYNSSNVHTLTDPSGWDRIISAFRSEGLAALATLVLALALAFYRFSKEEARDCKADPRKYSKVNPDLQEGNLHHIYRNVVQEQMPTKESMAATVIVTVCICLRLSRRLVIVLDDATGCAAANRSTASTAASGKNVVEKANLPTVNKLLQKLKVVNANVIFVTSNEALEKHLTDAATDTLIKQRMCPLELPEMAARLRRQGIDAQAGVTSPSSSQQPADVAYIAEVMRLYGEELALSAHFYRQVSISGMSIAKPSRVALAQMCETLVLQADTATAIYGAHPVKVDRYKNFPIEGCVPLPKPEHATDTSKMPGAVVHSVNAAEFIRQAFPGATWVPHRLVVPMILVSTTLGLTSFNSRRRRREHRSRHGRRGQERGQRPAVASEESALNGLVYRIEVPGEEKKASRRRSFLL